MTELDEIKQRKMEELKKKYEQQQEMERRAEEQMDSLMRQLLSEKAKARLGNVRMVNKELYFKAVQAIIYLYKAGQIKGKLDGEQLKELLKKLAERKEIKIKRK